MATNCYSRISLDPIARKYRLRRNRLSGEGGCTSDMLNTASDCKNIMIISTNIGTEIASREPMI